MILYSIPLLPRRERDARCLASLCAEKRSKERMRQSAETFFQSLEGKKIAVCGIGVSNRPLIELLCRYGAKVTACDKREPEALGEAAGHLQKLGAVLKTGPDYLENLDADIIFRTPGMPYTLPQLAGYRADGVTVTSEMEVFFDLCPAKLIGVTGSDGKTTTTTLIAEMLKAQGHTVHVGGNIGAPLLPKVMDMKAEDYAVVELSSFQLISMRQSPQVAVVTNVAPNHLDIHKDMQEYIDAKRNLFLHQTGFSRTVLNVDNAITASFAMETRGDTLLFSRTRPVRTGAYLGEDGFLYFSRNGKAERLFERAAIKLPGDHNVENYLAAICAVWGDVDLTAIRTTAETFGGVEHRIELVREKDGVRWYNDSIASSPTRTIAGLKAFPEKVILIAGGYDKHIPFDTLGPAVAKHVKRLILMGATADKIEEAVRACPDFDEMKTPILRVRDMEEAVSTAKAQAKPGDVVTLSPACASFDLYPNFAARGNHFKELVRALV